MRIMTVLGTRPEIIRLSCVIPLLDEHAEHTLVHTGQNFEPSLSSRFFQELKLRDPNVYLGIRGNGFGAQVGQLFEKIEPLLVTVRPDRLLVLGDTNSGLVAIVARRLGIPVYHMEAGNRCYDDRVPEEINRRVIDHSSSVLLPYTFRSKENLVREGIPREMIFVTGNPINEVLERYANSIQKSEVHQSLQLEKSRYFVATIHRAENVDQPLRLKALIEALGLVSRQYNMPIVCSLHPRTRSRASEFSIQMTQPGVRFVEPLGFFDFVALERDAFCILTDSGTVQEEACLFGVPNVTVRDVTERPETVECGSNIVVGCDPNAIFNGVRIATDGAMCWVPPVEYTATCVSRVVLRIVLGHLELHPS